MLARFAAAVPLEALDGDGAVLLRTALRWRGAPRKANGHRTALGSHQQPQQPQQPQQAPQQALEGRRLAPFSTRGSTAAARGSGAARGAQLQTLRPPVLGERSLRLLRELNRCSSLNPGLSPDPSHQSLPPASALPRPYPGPDPGPGPSLSPSPGPSLSLGLSPSPSPGPNQLRRAAVRRGSNAL